MIVNNLTDKELLKLAAKAAGYALSAEWSLPAEGIFLGKGIDGDLFRVWNPLKDDGDAFRLSVMLDMQVKSFPAGARVQYQNCILDTCEMEVINESDKYAATRRAIVRAAASIAIGLNKE